MRNTVRSIGVSLASMAGILLVSGTAWAQATETPITAQFVNASCELLEEPERDWVDEDGVRHYRNELGSCAWRRGLNGREIDWDNANVDLVNGYIEQWGYGTFTGRVLDGPETWGLVRYTLEAHRIEGVWHHTSDTIMHLEDGSLITMSAEWKSGERIIYSGVLLDPPGLGPVKRNRPRNK
ncbi:MAG: hypothetical protein JRF15_05320 [Deltaproteobacteria bacterium]|nr:hypothetical protein [Deltaproteobacteria bacterium]